MRFDINSIELITYLLILFMVYSGLDIKSIMEKEAIVSHLLQNVGKNISMSLVREFIAKLFVYFCSGFFFFSIMFYLLTRISGCCPVCPFSSHRVPQATDGWNIIGD